MGISYDKSLEATDYEMDVLTHALFTAQVGRLSESVYRGHGVADPSHTHDSDRRRGSESHTHDSDRRRESESHTMSSGRAPG